MSSKVQHRPDLTQESLNLTLPAQKYQPRIKIAKNTPTLSYLVKILMTLV